MSKKYSIIKIRFLSAIMKTETLTQKRRDFNGSCKFSGKQVKILILISVNGALRTFLKEAEITC